MNYENLFHQIIQNVIDTFYEVEFSQESAPQIEYRGPEDDVCSLHDEESQKIIMHRDVHFAGDFATMLEYYQDEEAPGIQEDIDIDRIYQLQELEQRLKKNIAPYVLGGREVEAISSYKALYRQFQELYEKAPEDSTERLIAACFLSDGLWGDLIKKAPSLSLAKEDLLIETLLTEQFQNPLSPGFGTVPQAMACLVGKIGSKKAMYALFSCIGKSQFALEEACLRALRSIGKKSLEFCVQKAFSDSSDQERALIVLSEFVPCPEVQECSLTLFEKGGFKEARLREYALGLLEQLSQDKTPRLMKLIEERAFSSQEMDLLFFLVPHCMKKNAFKK